MTLPSGSFDPAKTKSLFRAVFPSVMLPMFLAVSDQTIVASALPAMAASLGDVERVSLVVVTYLVAATVAAPVYGYLGDAFGRRRLMFSALGLFMGASVLCAIAPSIPLLAAARALQGLGGGGLMSLSQALIGEVVPPRQRGDYQAYMATVATVSSVFGPVAGGLLTQHFGWESIFFVNLPLGAVAFVLILRLPSRPAGATRAAFSFDMLGLLFFVGFIVPTLLALEQAREFDPKSLVSVIALFAVAAASFVLLLWREKRASSPLLAIDMFRQPVIWRANLLAMCHGAALTSLIAFLPIYFRVVNGASADEVGLMLVPISIGIGIGSIITGRLVTRTGMTMIFPTIGLIGTTSGIVAFAFLSQYLGLRALAAMLFFNSICMGTTMSVVQITVQSAAGRKFLGAAAGSVQFSRTVGAAFGTALMATVLFATLTFIDPGAATLFGRVINVGREAYTQLDVAQRAVLEGEIASAFRVAFLLVAAFTSMGIILAATNPSRRI